MIAAPAMILRSLGYTGLLLRSCLAHLVYRTLGDVKILSLCRCSGSTNLSVSSRASFRAFGYRRPSLRLITIRFVLKEGNYGFGEIM